MCFHSEKILKQSETKMDNLPVELKFNIFSRLRAKNLCLIKCVSTEWNHLISDPHFLEDHYEKSKRNRKTLLLNQLVRERDEVIELQMIHAFSVDTEEKREFDMIYKFQGWLDMMPSGHCLVCIGNIRGLYIFNPSAIKIHVLPRLAYTRRKELVAGFGYSPLKNEYVVVHLFMRAWLEDYEEEYMECEIMSLQPRQGHAIRAANSWRVMKNRCPLVLEGIGVYVDNVFYWMVSKDGDHTEKELIVALDLEEEKFSVFPHPQVKSYLEDNVIKLGELNGYLSLIDMFAWPCIANVWMMTDYKKQVWEKKYTMDLTKLVGFDDELTIITCFGLQNGEIALMSQQREVDYYDVEKREFRKGKDLGLRQYSQACLYTDVFPARNN